MLKAFFVIAMVLVSRPYTYAVSDSKISSIQVTDTSDETVLDFSEGAKKLPFAIDIIPEETLKNENIYRLSEVSRVDAAMTESYNSPGYWDSIALRGYLLDPRTSYLREGLPISGETAIALDNKERIEVLKGLQGIHSGASVPGGVINYVVKRPTVKPMRSLLTSVTDRGQALLHLDISDSINDKYKYRVQGVTQSLKPAIQNAQGERSLLAAALQGDLEAGFLLEAEVEWSLQRQPTQAAWSLLGARLPGLVDPTLNLNNQAWSQPVVFEGLTGSVKLTKSFTTHQEMSLQIGRQFLKTQDRLAYPFGCSAENVYDRYCSNGRFDLYDYRSEGEERIREQAKLAYKDQFYIQNIKNQLHFDISVWTAEEKARPQSYNLVGEGSVDGNIQVPGNAAALSAGTSRNYGATEAALYDRLSWQQWSLWLGTKQSFLNRASERTDGSRKTNYNQSVVSPWIALSREGDLLTSYLSYAEGSESFVTPNRGSYQNPGQFLSDVKSSQWEFGFKGQQPIQWTAAVFSISRSLVLDEAPLYQVDGIALHRGVEVTLSEKVDRWFYRVSGMHLQAQQEQRFLRSELNGKRPVNVPAQTLRAYVVYDLIPERWTLNGWWLYESNRAVTSDNSMQIPEWHRFDLGVRYTGLLRGNKSAITARLENVLDRRYWQESPTQYGHIYLYPGSARQAWIQLELSL